MFRARKFARVAIGPRTRRFAIVIDCAQMPALNLWFLNANLTQKTPYPSDCAMFTRRFVISALLASAAVPVFAEAPLTSLRPRAQPLRGAAKVKAAHKQKGLKQIVAEAGLSGTVSIVVTDASGRVLESETPNNALPPASVTKAVTALYALQHLGSDFRYATRVIATGPIANGIVQGDLVAQRAVAIRIWTQMGWRIWRGVWRSAGSRGSRASCGFTVGRCRTSGSLMQNSPIMWGIIHRCRG